MRKKLSTIRELSTKQQALLALILILPAPLIGVSCSLHLPPIRYFQNEIGEIEIGKIIWLAAKIWMVLLPVFWLLFVDQGKLSWSKSSRSGIVAGILTSIPVASVIILGYLLVKDHLIDLSAAKQQMIDLGIASPVRFWVFATAIVLGNSLMEEYVWRWFVFTKCKTLVGAWPAIFLSAFFFTVHHVVVMWNIGSIGLVVIASSGIFLGGFIWAWLYNKYNSIWPGWICHVAADSAVIWIMWQILIETN